MLILNADDVRRALPMAEAVSAMKVAYARLSEGRAEVPLRSRLSIPAHDALTLLMPAFVGDDDSESLAVKVVSLFPSNPGRGLPYIQAAVLVLEPDTGRAVGLLEGSTLTAIRTGAAGAAAVDLLARPESRNLAIFGAGVQGRAQLEAACTVRDFETAWIFDTSRENAARMAGELAGVGSVPRDLRLAATPAEAVAGADVICTATTSTTPVFSDADLKPGTHISAVGSYNPDMQELPADAVRRSRLFVDLRSAALSEAGDLIQPIRAGIFGEDHIAGELGDLVLGRVQGRRTADEITIFKSVGVAIQDAVAARLAIQNARERGLGREIAF